MGSEDRSCVECGLRCRWYSPVSGSASRGWCCHSKLEEITSRQGSVPVFKGETCWLTVHGEQLAFFDRQLRLTV